MSLRELALVGVGGVVGTTLGVAMNHKTDEYPNPYKHPYTVKEEEPQGEFSFTYYRISAIGAFNHVANHQIEELQARGYTVRVRDLHDHIRFFKHGPEQMNDFAVVHPLFHTKPKALDYLKKCHRYIVSFEVADTTMIGSDFVRYANDDRIDMMCLPSTFAIEAYRRSGVMNRLLLVPHGVHSKYGDQVTTENPAIIKLRQDERVKVLVTALHSGYRKGFDVTLRVLRELVRRGRKIVVVAKTFPPPMDMGIVHDLKGARLPHYVIRDWLTEEEMISLYDSCDVLLHPYRSGAFELNPLEALARGLPVVTTGWGCVLDYANVHTAYMISPTRLVKIFPAGLYGHTGMGADPDVDHAVELTDWVIQNLDYCKKKARRNRGEFVARSWDKCMDEFLRGCEEVWT